MLNKRLCTEILKCSAGGNRSQLSTLATTLSLFCDDYAVSQLIAEGLQQKVYTIDAELIEVMFRRSAEYGKVAVATSDLAYLLPPDNFRRLFSEALSVGRNVRGAMARLAGTLRDFILQNPEHAERYGRVIRAMLKSKRPRVSDRAVEMLGFLGFHSEGDLSIWHKSLLSRSANRRRAAVRCLYFALARNHAVSAAFARRWKADQIELRLAKMAVCDQDDEVRGWTQSTLQQCAGEIENLRT